MLYDDVAGLSSPQYLAANASALGMVINESPNYLRLSDGAHPRRGPGRARRVVGRRDRPRRGAQRADHRHSARDRARTRRSRARPVARDDPDGTSRRRRATGRDREHSAAAHRRTAHPEHTLRYMTTKSTRSPRRRTVVALAVVLAVLAGFIVRLVDIQVVNADEHIEDSLANALGGGRPLYGTRGEHRRRVRADARRQHPAVRRPARPARTSGPLKRDERQGQGRRGPVDRSRRRDRRDHRPDGRRGPEGRRRRARAADPDSQYALLKRGLTTEQFRALADLGIPFLYFEPHPARTYPDGAVAGNLVGFMGIDGEPLGGLEQSENDCLTATDGTLVVREGQGRGRSSPAPRSRTPPSTAAR